MRVSQNQEPLSTRVSQRNRSETISISERGPLKPSLIFSANVMSRQSLQKGRIFPSLSISKFINSKTFYHLLRHVIYDAYKAELVRREAETEKSNKDKKEATKPAAPLPSSSLEKSLAITERIVNQNTHLDIADDFRFFEDESDEYRDGEGTLLPLWIYNFAQAKKLSVTSTQWSSKYHDLFAVGLGSYNYARQGIGYLLFYSLKNPSYPGNKRVLASDEKLIFRFHLRNRRGRHVPRHQHC